MFIRQIIKQLRRNVTAFITPKTGHKFTQSSTKKRCSTAPTYTCELLTIKIINGQLCYSFQLGEMVQRTPRYLSQEENYGYKVNNYKSLSRGMYRLGTIEIHIKEHNKYLDCSCPAASQIRWEVGNG